MLRIFYLCHLAFDPGWNHLGHNEMYAVRTVEVCSLLERSKGAYASHTQSYNLNNYNDMMNYQAHCGPEYRKCPIYKGN